MATATFTPAKLPDLPYDYNALEPVLSKEILEVHHKKHHNTYIVNYNAAVEQLVQAIQQSDTKKICSLQSAIKFNGGSHINHSTYWDNLAPVSNGGGKLPDENSELTKLVKQEFGSYEKLIEEFNKRAAAIQGSGWQWLGYDKTTKTVVLADTPNQDPLTAAVPLLTVDMWEHAWYLQYKNVKADYLKEIWKVVNWKKAEERLAAALSS